MPLSKKPSSVFGDLKSLGDSLFSTGNESTTAARGELTSNSSSSMPQIGATLTQKGSEHDYKALLTNFYRKYNPGKLVEVDRTLEKFKVRNVNLLC